MMSTPCPRVSSRWSDVLSPRWASVNLSCTGAVLLMQHITISIKWLIHLLLNNKHRLHAFIHVETKLLQIIFNILYNILIADSNSGLSKMMGSGVRLQSGCCVINTLSFHVRYWLQQCGTRYWMECGSDSDSDSNDARQTSLVSAQIVSQVDAELKNMIYQ